MTRGLWVAVEGADGGGKTAAIAVLQRECEAAKREWTRCIDPGGTLFGAKVRELLLHDKSTQLCPQAEAMLFMASRAQLVAEVIAPAIDAGLVVLTDRSPLSTLVYQGYAAGGRVNTRAAIISAGAFVMRGYRPDLTFVFDCPVDVATKRREAARRPDKIEARGDAFLKHVRDGYIVEAINDTSGATILLDASQPMAAVHAGLAVVFRRWLADQTTPES